MTILTIRNRTAAFKQLRDTIIRRKERFHLGPTHVTLTQKLLSDQAPAEVELMSLNEADFHATPSWMTAVENVQSQLASLRETLDRLQKVQKRKMAFVFETKESDHSMIILSNEVNEKMQSINAEIARIARPSPNEDQMTSRLRLNAARGLTADLAELNRQYRQGQRQFIQETRSKTSVPVEDEKPEDFANPSEQQRQIQLMRSQNTSRRQEFEHIMRTVEEIEAMFAHASTLVIDQGSMVDRIDFNIEKTLEGADRGNVILHQIEQRQRSGLAKQVSKVLLVLNMIMFTLNVLKFWPSRWWPKLF